MDAPVSHLRRLMNIHRNIALQIKSYKKCKCGVDHSLLIKILTASHEDIAEELLEYIPETHNF